MGQGALSRCATVLVTGANGFVGSAVCAALGVHTLVPGLTGWAQVNGRDELPIPEKVKLDVAYLQRQSLWFDIRIVWMTFVKVLRRDGVSH